MCESFRGVLSMFRWKKKNMRNVSEHYTVALPRPRYVLQMYGSRSQWCSVRQNHFLTNMHIKLQLYVGWLMIIRTDFRNLTSANIFLFHFDSPSIDFCKFWLLSNSFSAFSILSLIACVAWRFWLGALSNKGGRGQRNREEIGAEQLGGKSPSVKLMSRRENKELAKTNLKNVDKTMQELQHIGSIKDLRPKNS